MLSRESQELQKSPAGSRDNLAPSGEPTRASSQPAVKACSPLHGHFRKRRGAREGEMRRVIRPGQSADTPADSRNTATHPPTGSGSSTLRAERSIAASRDATSRSGSRNRTKDGRFAFCAARITSKSCRNYPVAGGLQVTPSDVYRIMACADEQLRQEWR